MTNYPSPRVLWNLNPLEFNEWRATNDLPLLFANLKELLPSFSDWLNTLPFDMETVLRVTPSGHLFEGDTVRTLVRRKSFGWNGEIFTSVKGPADLLNARPSYISQTIIGEFLPYFLWSKLNLGKKRTFTYDHTNRQRADNFRFTSWAGLNVANCSTKAFLLNGFEVLKLGQHTLDRNVSFIERNLDFTNLDFLQIRGEYRGTANTSIHYSSCRDLEFLDSSEAFFKFHRCAMGDFICSNSRLQDIYFEHCDMSRLILKNSFIMKMGFNETNMTPMIENCELHEINYIPPRDASPARISTTYRLLRTAYQSRGFRQEASYAYYKERVFERKSLFNPQAHDSNAYPGLAYGASISRVFQIYRTGFFDKSNIRRPLIDAIKSKFKLYTHPKYLIPLIISRFRWCMSMIDSLLWGYGEKPGRILVAASVLIAAYAGVYDSVAWIDENGAQYAPRLSDCLYFSVVTFTTLGYGDITPKTDLLKALAASQAALGAFTMGLIVAGFSNRSRY